MLYLARACYKAGKLKEAKSVLLKVNKLFFFFIFKNFLDDPEFRVGPNKVFFVFILGLIKMLFIIKGPFIIYRQEEWRHRTLCYFIILP